MSVQTCHFPLSLHFCSPSFSTLLWAPEAGRVLVPSSDCFPPMGGITIWKSRRTVMSVHPSVKRPFTKFSSHFLGRLYHLFHLTDTMRQSRDSHQHKPQLPPGLEAQKVGKAQEPGHTLWETWARSFHWVLEPQGDLSA